MVDASIYLYNGLKYHGESRCDTEGNDCGAILGLIDCVTYIARQGAVDIVCAFDGSRELLERRRMFPAYKAQRPAVSTTMADQRRRAYDVMQDLGIMAIRRDKYEADDIIATVAKSARAEKRAVTVISADRDLVQVLCPGDEIWNLAADQRQSFSTACRKLRLLPAQMPDFIALCGDKSDNIPGVPGVNRGLAVRLLRKWKCVETLFANLDALPAMRIRGAPGLEDSLRRHRDQVYLAKALATMDPVNLDADELMPPETDAARISEICTKHTLDEDVEGVLQNRLVAACT